MPFFNINLLSDLKLRNPIRGRKLVLADYFASVAFYLKLRNPIRGRKRERIYTGCKIIKTFEIKKPHKGTETSADMPLIVTLIDLKLRNPIRGRKHKIVVFKRFNCYHLKLRNPIRGRKPI